MHLRAVVRRTAFRGPTTESPRSLRGNHQGRTQVPQLLRLTGRQGNGRTVVVEAGHFEVFFLLFRMKTEYKRMSYFHNFDWKELQ